MPSGPGGESHRPGVLLDHDDGGRSAHILSADFGAGGSALSTRRIAPSHERSDVSVALLLRNPNLARPVEPREAPLAMPRGSSDRYFLVPRPASLFPVSLAVKNEQVTV